MSFVCFSIRGTSGMLSVSYIVTKSKLSKGIRFSRTWDNKRSNQDWQKHLVPLLQAQSALQISAAFYQGGVDGLNAAVM